jgi:hypothetical protein
MPENRNLESKILHLGIWPLEPEKTRLELENLQTHTFLGCGSLGPEKTNCDDVLILGYGLWSPKKQDWS